jgi:SHS2 domain-containing protein
MTFPSPAGYQEIEHTADRELLVWAPDLPGVLEQAARGMYTLSGAQKEPGLRHERKLDLLAADAESLLVGFLSELLFISEQEGLIFDSFELALDDGLAGDTELHLQANLQGSSLASLDKEIKAVTYHQLEIQSTNQGLRVNIVFDV